MSKLKRLPTLKSFWPALFFGGLLSACSHMNSNSSENSSSILSAQDAHIAVMGRTQNHSNGSRTMSYPGVSFFLEVKAAELSMEAFSNTGNAWVDVIVDNAPPQLIKIGQATANYSLFQFPQVAKHKVRVTLRTENWQAITTINHFAINQGKSLTSPQLPQRKLLILGDSVTCGEMIDRVASESRNSRWSNARESYGLLTAEALNAQVHLACHGGRGLIRSWDGRTDELNLPDFYALALPNANPPIPWQPEHYTPDFILSAIGTNDFTQGIPDKETYVKTYVTLVQRILMDYPKAQIALTEGAILNGEKKAALIDFIATTIARLNSPRVHQITSTYYPGDEQDGHPTKQQHRAMAEDLAPQIKTIMNW